MNFIASSPGRIVPFGESAEYFGSSNLSSARSEDGNNGSVPSRLRKKPGLGGMQPGVFAPEKRKETL
jgi:hypothetical protein